MKILVAEDNIEQQMLIGLLMDHWGYDFDIASNGRKVVELANKNEGKYDLCLMDIDMPIMNGFEATNIIRRTMEYFPIMAVTGNSISMDKYLEVGLDDYLQKPYDPYKLYAKINELTLKIIKVEFKDNKLNIKKEMPMNPQQASILREFKKQKLSMISIFGTSTEATFVVNEVVPQYIEKEFAENKKHSVKFLDHNPEGKGLCRLFAKTSMVVKTFMLDEDFESENQQEIAKLKEIVINSESLNQ